MLNINKENSRVACRKCGYSGHLTYQCRNFIRADPAKDVTLDVSSTSSSSDESDNEADAYMPVLPKKPDDKSNYNRDHIFLFNPQTHIQVI